MTLNQASLKRSPQIDYGEETGLLSSYRDQLENGKLSQFILYILIFYMILNVFSCNLKRRFH